MKAFNNIYFGHLATLGRPSGDPDRSVITIAGDDDAKKTVTDFLDQIGYDAYDVGPLSEGWRFQPDTPAYGGPYVVPGEAFPRSQARASGHWPARARRGEARGGQPAITVRP